MALFDTSSNHCTLKTAKSCLKALDSSIYSFNFLFTPSCLSPVGIKPTMPPGTYLLEVFLIQRDIVFRVFPKFGHRFLQVLHGFLCPACLLLVCGPAFLLVCGICGMHFLQAP